MALWLYFKAVGKHWWALLSCAVFTLMGVYAVATQRTSTWIVWATFFAAFFLLLVAGFLAWKDEHEKVVSAQEQVDVGRPKLTIHFPNQLALYQMRVYNHGQRPAFDVFMSVIIQGDFECKFEPIQVVKPNDWEQLLFGVTKQGEWHNVFSRGGQYFCSMLEDGMTHTKDQLRIPLNIWFRDQGKQRLNTLTIHVARPEIRVTVEDQVN